MTFRKKINIVTYTGLRTHSSSWSIMTFFQNLTVVRLVKRNPCFRETRSFTLKLSVCLIKYHEKKMYGVGGDGLQLHHSYPLDRQLRGPQIRSQCYGDETNILTLPGTEVKFLVHPAYRPWPCQLSYPGLPFTNKSPFGNILPKLNAVPTLIKYFFKLDFSRMLPRTSKYHNLLLSFRISQPNF